MSVSTRALMSEARKALAKAYAPYSGVRVGSVLLDCNGRIFQGANIENASFGLSICAERVAIASALMEDSRSWKAIAISSDLGASFTPCGACLQMLLEFSDGDMNVIWGSCSESCQTALLRELLPKPLRLER